MDSKANILVVDDDRTNRLVLKSILAEHGFSSVAVEDGQLAVDKVLASGSEFDVILMDVMMPVLNGYEATKIIKKKIKYFIPVIFLTALTDDTAIVKCLDAGGDDFLSKPYSHVVLIAKINSMLRISALYKKISQQGKEIEHHNARMTQEMELAKKLFTDLSVKAESEVLSGLRYYMSPISMFNGDILLFEKNQSSGHEILMGDFTGHGLSAAIGSIPVADVFHAMTRKGCAFQQTIIEINEKLHRLLPTQMFMSAAYVSVNRENHLLCVVNAGLPDMYLVRDQEVMHEFKSNNLPLGITNLYSDQLDVQMVTLEYGDRLIMASDGLIEAQNVNNEFFGRQQFVDIIHDLSSDQDLFETILSECDRFTSGRAQTDDISLLEMTYLEKIEGSSSNKQIAEVEAGEWSVQVELDANSLKHFDVLPYIMHFINGTQTIDVGHSTIYTIITEVYTNAMDHGLLKLDSSLKDSAEGYLDYYRERKQRLQVLTEGTINISIKYKVDDDSKARLVVEVSDSGDGFDYKRFQVSNNDYKKYSGRGIAMLDELCSELEYSSRGNQVKLVYEWCL